MIPCPHCIGGRMAHDYDLSSALEDTLTCMMCGRHQSSESRRARDLRAQVEALRVSGCSETPTRDTCVACGVAMPESVRPGYSRQHCEACWRRFKSDEGYRTWQARRENEENARRACRECGTAFEQVNPGRPPEYCKACRAVVKRDIGRRAMARRRERRQELRRVEAGT